MDQTLIEIHTPQGIRTMRCTAEPGQGRLTDVLRGAGLALNTRCGQRSICDGCAIELLEGALRHFASGRLVEADRPLLLRACEHALAPCARVVIRVPQRSLLGHWPDVLTDFSLRVPFSHDPLYVAASRDERSVGAAIDIGTTTVVVLLADLHDGRILSRACSFNRQTELGDDVLTRITLCLNNPQMPGVLKEAVARHTIAPLLRQALDQARIPCDLLRCMTVVGNTTMLHLFAGEDPSSLGTVPFRPRFLEHRVLSAEAAFSSSGQHRDISAAGDRVASAEQHSSTIPELPCSTAAEVHLLPSAAAYIGADLTAGTIASGLLYDQGPSMLVDVGTNGEIILKHGDRLIGCATAAGPAFEGAGLSSGTRAVEGAICGIHLHTNPFRVETEIIGQEGNTGPVGLCGSAYIDFLAEARRVGLLGPTGRFQPHRLPEARDRLIPWGRSDMALCVAGSDHRLVISQYDISRLLQAKAAVAAGILVLLKRAGLRPCDVKNLYLAGAFGTHMNLRRAIRCGLLPGFRPDQVIAVGNSALAGAYVALLDRNLLEEMSRASRLLQVIELNLDPDFEGTYIDNLLLPEPSEP